MAAGAPDTCARPTGPVTSPSAAPDLDDPGAAADPAAPAAAELDPATALDDPDDTEDTEDTPTIGPPAAGPDDGPANATTGAASESTAIAANGTSTSDSTAMRWGGRPAGLPGRAQIDIRAWR